MPGTRDGKELGHEVEQENNQRIDEQEAEAEKAQHPEQEEIREAQSYEPQTEEEPTAERVRAGHSARGQRGTPPEKP